MKKNYIELTNLNSDDSIQIFISGYAYGGCEGAIQR